MHAPADLWPFPCVRCAIGADRCQLPLHSGRPIADTLSNKKPEQGRDVMKFGVFYELQLPKPWNEGDEARLFHEAL